MMERNKILISPKLGREMKINNKIKWNMCLEFGNFSRMKFGLKNNIIGVKEELL